MESVNKIDNNYVSIKLMNGKELAENNFKKLPTILNNKNNKFKKKNDNDKQVFQFNDEVLFCERIEKQSARSIAIIDENSLIKVIKKYGKWNYYGFFTNGQQYLHNFEALYLIEMNRLELYYNSVIVSLEQAYSLFINDNKYLSNNNTEYLTIQEYLVYSHLMRTGYFICKYDLVNDKNNYMIIDDNNRQPITYKNDIILSEREQYVWMYLHELNDNCNDKQQINKIITNKKSYSEIIHAFNEIKEKMQLQNTIANNAIIKCDDEENSKNKSFKFNEKCNVKKKDAVDDDYQIPEKKLKLEDTSRLNVTKGHQTNQNYLDILLDEDCLGFDNIFKKLQIIELKEMMSIDDETDTDIESVAKFNFDLYASNDTNFTKSQPGIPDYRIIISKQPPSRQFVTKQYALQYCKVPILVIFVTELMDFNAFIYRFSKN